MNVKEIMNIMFSKGYYYFTGLYGPEHEVLVLDFSTGHNGRGSFLNINIYQDGRFSLSNRETKGEEKIVTENELSTFLLNLVEEN
jgi:hypothetical protein